MRKPLAAAVLLATALPLGACANGGGLFGGSSSPYGDRVYNPTSDQVADNTVIYRDETGRYYCRRENGTTGTLIGAGAGALLGGLISPGGSSTVGAILGGAGGALAGRAIDRNDLACR